MTAQSVKILIVDDDPGLRNVLTVALEREGYGVQTTANGRDAVTHVFREAPDLIVLDIGLPHLDGFAVCREVRTRSEVPILFLTAREDEIDKVLGFEMGADDYVTKPFSPRELVARVKAILKRSGNDTQPAQHLTFGSITLGIAEKRCSVDGQPLALTATEFKMIELLMKSPGALVSRVSLIEAIWGPNSLVSDRTLDSHLRNLRKKLTSQGHGRLIETVHGQGVRLVATT
ncbi:response regulator transcription factor [uncultured Roseobacter sp.]|uniref:response regulator transcription factor n=1 Tax=uncultured Roseobacter sp. TaxID=114847 RepID=UPI00261F331D|nr:response regulator transcription factor [uncultured Roseobacter sp.]